MAKKNKAGDKTPAKKNEDVVKVDPAEDPITPTSTTEDPIPNPDPADPPLPPGEDPATPGKPKVARSKKATSSEPKVKVFKSLQPGVSSLPVIIDGTKRYLRFNKHTIRLTDPVEIAAMEEIYEEDKNKMIKHRRVLTEDEFLQHTSPESLLVEVDGLKYHISDVREAVRIAAQHGWEPKAGEKVIIQKSNVIQGGTSAGIGGI